MKKILVLISLSLFYFSNAFSVTLYDALNQTYQRITQNMFKNMPKYASIILNLNSNHQIKTAVYKSK